jgi:MFS family permease
MEVGESDSLLNGTKKSSGALHNFIVMCVAFGVVHGAITVAIAYASSVFSLLLGSYSSAMLYSTYTLSSLLFAAPLVERFGARDMMVFSIFAYMMYLVFYVIGSQVSDVGTRWFFVISGSLLGGLASGIGWVSQGVYFATSADFYTKENDYSREEANNLFASYFASIYIGLQALLYLVSSLLLEFTSFDDEDLFIFYSLLCFITFVYVFFYLEQLSVEPSLETSLQHTKAVITMTFTNRRAIALSPMAITFGFISVFISTYVNDEVIKDYIDTYAVGYLGVIQTATVSILAVPWNHFLGVEGVLIAGTFAYALVAGAFLEFSNKQLGNWNYIWMVYVLYGIGRISWETTTKAIVADFYPFARSTAFANLNFLSGLASTCYSFMTSDLSAAALAISFLVPALLILPGYYYALSVPSQV